MPSNDYWTKQFDDMADKYSKQGDKSLPTLKGLFANTNKEIQKELALFYTKYGKAIQSPIFETLADGTSVMVGSTSKTAVTMTDVMKFGRLTKLDDNIFNIFKELKTTETKYMTSTLSDIGGNAYQQLYYETFKGYGVGFQISPLEGQALKGIITNPVNGLSYPARVVHNTGLLDYQVKQMVHDGIVKNVSINEMSKSLAAKMKSGYEVAKTLIRTEVNNTYNQATLQGYKDTNGIVEKYQFLGTLDNRTSDICQKLDLKVYDLKDATTGLNYPPMHTRCRSTTKAKFDDEVFERRARAKDGKTYTVPNNMNYAEWKEKHGY